MSRNQAALWVHCLDQTKSIFDVGRAHAVSTGFLRNVQHDIAAARETLSEHDRQNHEEYFPIAPIKLT